MLCLLLYVVIIYDCDCLGLMVACVYLVVVCLLILVV